MISSMNQHDYDVAIIGGGPGGTTTGTLLKKYAPHLRVLILEREAFPRDHIGESLLPPTCEVLHEMGCWDAIERSNFPVKIGGTYTWGKSVDPWVFELVPAGMVPEVVERPGKYEGWRLMAAFQVDRSVYDKILLDHAATMGCEVREQSAVTKIHRDGDRVTALELSNGQTITARYYIDASGNAAVLRRAMEVKCEVPTKLMNVAFWDYWENQAWADEPDAKATRIHIRSLPFGWMWFIRLSPIRFSVGLITPADYYKKCGKRPAELYEEAVRLQPQITERLVGATPRGKVEGTTDWSFVVERTYGENWFLVGECAGFADPILSAGITLTQTGARELAYSILELERGEHDPTWLRQRYDELQTRRVRQHMKFADFWYSANGLFDAVRENCVEIAREAGFKMNMVDAFRWLSFGGLGDDLNGQAGVGGLDLTGVKQVMMRMTEGDAGWKIDGMTHFKLNLAGAKESKVGVLNGGRIHPVRSWIRKDTRLSEANLQGVVIEALQRHSAAPEIMQYIAARIAQLYGRDKVQAMITQSVQVLEVMANEFWVMCEKKKNAPALQVHTPYNGPMLHDDHGESKL